MRRSLLIAILLMVLLAGCGPARSETPTTVPPTAQPDTLYVDPGRELGPISPYVYGSNISMEGIVPPDMLQQAYDAHITVLRGPGGGWGEVNDLQPFQIDLIVALCKKMGAIPVISVGLKNGTPEAAAALVHYANIEKGYQITYWSIGNENDDPKGLGKIAGTVSYNQQWRAIALAMKAVDPKIKLMGPELHQWGIDNSKTPKYPPTETPNIQDRQDWMTEFLKANGDLVDIVTVHRYPFYAPTDKKPITVERLRQDTLEWEPMVTYLRGMVKQITGRDLPIAFTEVNSDPSTVTDSVASPDSFYNAIWYADVLGRLIQQNVFMVNQWLLAQRSGGLGLIYNSELRPTYYVFQMYSQFGSERVYSSSGMDFVSVYAAKRTDGTLTIMVINLTDGEQSLTLKIQGKTPRQADVWRFDATHNAEDLGKQAMSADGVVDLQAQSITLYAIGK